MLLVEKMKKTKFSGNESIVINFVLDKEENINKYTTIQIAKETYTSTSTIVRIAKKLGFNGWTELKEAYINELKYIKTNFNNLDANIPFQKDDSINTIASNITQLHIESAKDTFFLLNSQMMSEAASLINKSQKVHIFTVSNLSYLAEIFTFNLSRIKKDIHVDSIQDNMYHNAMMLTKNDCAICVSYSGETRAILDIAKILRKRGIPIIVITSVGENHLEKYGDVVLHICTREKSISKIAGYTSLHSISLIFDILYSIIFSLNYKNNLNYKIEIAKAVETNRKIENDIIKE